MDRIIDTGTVIKAYLESNEITITQLAEASDVSIKSVYRVLNNETRLSYKIAWGINKLLPEISIDFLMSYDAKYHVQLKEYEKETGISNYDYLINKFQLKKLFPSLANDRDALIKKGNEIFSFNKDNVYELEGIINYDSANNAKEFERKIWIIASYKEYCEDNEILEFNENKFSEILKDTINYCGTINKEMTIFNMKELCSYCGINFIYKESIRNSRIKAATLKDRNGKIFILLSDLFKCVEGSWVSFVHELIHIKNRDYDKENLIFEEVRKDNEEKIENETFCYFVNQEGKPKNREYSVNDILEIAKINGIPSGISAYLIRNKIGKYNDASINELIHYY